MATDQKQPLSARERIDALIDREEECEAGQGRSPEKGWGAGALVCAHEEESGGGCVERAKTEPPLGA
jgi:hypothetical protein